MSRQPKLRVDVYYDIQGALDVALRKANAQNSIIQCCLNCINFREHQNEVCGLALQRPPARVIAFGCNSWEDKDEIPF